MNRSQTKKKVMPEKTNIIIIGAAAAATTLATAFLLWQARRRQQEAEARRRSEEEADALDFKDPAEHRFTILLNHVEPKLVEIAKVVKQLQEERSAALQELGKKVLAEGGDMESARQKFAEDFCDKNRRRIIECDKKITKTLISIDGVNLGANPSPALKEQRKEIIRRYQSVAVLVNAFGEVNGYQK